MINVSKIANTSTVRVKVRRLGLCVRDKGLGLGCQSQLLHCSVGAVMAQG